MTCLSMFHLVWRADVFFSVWWRFAWKFRGKFRFTMPKSDKPNLFSVCVGLPTHRCASGWLHLLISSYIPTPYVKLLHPHGLNILFVHQSQFLTFYGTLDMGQALVTSDQPTLKKIKEPRDLQALGLNSLV